MGEKGRGSRAEQWAALRIGKAWQSWEEASQRVRQGVKARGGPLGSVVSLKSHRKKHREARRGRKQPCRIQILSPPLTTLHPPLNRHLPLILSPRPGMHQHLVVALKPKP